MIPMKRFFLLLLVLGLLCATFSAESVSEQEYDDDEIAPIVPEKASPLGEKTPIAETADAKTASSKSN
ncbi:hypothetical protein DSO57_1023514 [Entomophthora muscae]|uniref:Uncharacterized protein n=1 Tax=Entomophthora muscae TaxID=34485 RepID=A0ACC2UD10_9FUNG|nr:hypothetical protein DSO57_1023514 [Entomophthora muscae]